LQSAGTSRTLWHNQLAILKVAYQGGGGKGESGWKEGGWGGWLMQLQFLAAIIEINFQAEQTSNNLGVIA